MDERILEQLKKTEFMMLCMLDEYCHLHGIQYSLYAGTALGAVRHKGFIPWDDDVDIVMTRDNFNLFCDTWNHNPVEGYSLSCPLYDQDCPTCHAKIHKENTLFLMNGDIEDGSNQGIWIDIFPLDKIGNRINMIQVFSKGLELILLTRVNNIKTNESVKKKTIRKVTSLIPKEFRYKRIKKCIKWLSENDNRIGKRFHYVSLSAVYAFKYHFPSNMTNKVKKIEFEGRQFDIFTDYDQMLKLLYGDYMEMPPEKQRKCTHNPVKVVFDNELGNRFQVK